jgi:hypothetical protein
VSVASIGGVTGHAFISYVHEDKSLVDRLEQGLESVGFRVWRDTKELWPGDEWRTKIREAITSDSLVFLACISDNSVAKTSSYQHEELALAVDEFRQRPPGQGWLIPIRFSECKLPSYDLGAGRTLDSLQRVDLIGDNWEGGIGRLSVSVDRAFGALDQAAGRDSIPRSAATNDPTAFVKATLLDPTRQIELDDYVSVVATNAAGSFTNRDLFPLESDRLTNDRTGFLFLADQVEAYWVHLEPFLATLATGCTWGTDTHLAIWTRSVDLVVNSSSERSGQSALLNLQKYPILPTLYCGCLAALHRNNWAAFRAVAIDARYRQENTGPVSLIGAAHVWRPFENLEVLANVIARQAATAPAPVDAALMDQVMDGSSKLISPISDYLAFKLRPLFSKLIPNEDDYTATFDRLEVLLGAVAVDAETQALANNIYLDGPWFGSFIWHESYNRNPIEQVILSEARESGERWGPLKGGLFGGRTERAVAALESFADQAAKRRSQRW